MGLPAAEGGQLLQDKFVELSFWIHRTSISVMVEVRTGIESTVIA